MDYTSSFLNTANMTQSKWKQHLEREMINTKWAASLVAKLRMSAQETTPGHRSSSTILILSISSNPPSPWFCGAFFSEFRPSSSIDPSQPYTRQSNTCMLF